MNIRTRIVTFNIRTLLEPSRLTQLCKEFVTYKLTLLGVCEIRWCEPGEFTTSNSLTILFSGKPSNELPRSSVVGIVLSKQAKRAFMDWKPRSDRIITVSVRGHGARNITFVQSYAPTDTSEMSVKETFYNHLDGVLER